MNRKAVVGGLVVAIAVAGLVFGAYQVGMKDGMSMGNAPPAPAPTGERKVLYWHDPMVPGPRFDKPGKSPFMDMQLVPVYADDASSASGVAISSRLQQNLGVRTAKAVAKALSNTVSAVGNVAYNERDVVLVQARSNGFVEKLHVRATLD